MFLQCVGLRRPRAGTLCLSGKASGLNGPGAPWFHSATGRLSNSSPRPRAATREGRRYWTEFAHKAATDLAPATGRTALSAAAKKLMRAKTEVKRLQPENPT